MTRLPLTDLHAVVRDGVRAQLILAGLDPEHPSVVDTPERVLRAWLELTAAPGDPATILGSTFDAEGADAMIVVGPMPFASLCEHHLLPFTGVATFAYIPTNRIIGLSKIPRLLHHYALRPQVQERLTHQVIQTFTTHIECRGAGLQLTATHTCAALRGVRTHSPMTTTALHGALRNEPDARAEFLHAVQPHN